MDAESWKIAHRYFESCCSSLFADAGLTMKMVDDIDAKSLAFGTRVAAFIGFTGDQLRGAVTLNIPTTLVGRMYPSAAGDATEPEQYRDWGGEIANQILGRFKNCLLRHGVVLQISTPSTLIAERVRSVRSRAPGSIVLYFVSGSDQVVISFDAVARKTVDLTTVLAPDAVNQLAEGQAIMFE